MKWTTRILFLLAISLTGMLIAMVSLQRTRTPESALAAIAATIENGEYSHNTLLRSLDASLKELRASGDQDLQIRALSLRGDLLLELGAAEAARTDFEEIGFLQGTPAEDVLLRLAAADVLAGEPGEGQRRITALLERNPTSTKAHVQRARLSLASAQQELDACEVILIESLAHDETQIASALVDRLAAQDLLDPHRAGVVSSLREFFTESDGERLARVLMQCDSASLFSRAARESLEVSFTHGSDPLGVYEYITLLMRADQPVRAMRFGAQIRRDPEIAAHHLTSLQLIRAHLQAEDAEGAGTLAAELIQSTQSLTPDEYADCCQALLKAERWSGLFHAASRLRIIGTSVDGLKASLYMGLAQEGRKHYGKARILLRSFANSNLPAPYPGAYYEAWTTLARLNRAADRSFDEREAIHAALQLDPDGPDASELWVRLAELQDASGHTSPVMPLRSYAEALCREPENYEEIFRRFEEVGLQVVTSKGLDLELTYQDLVRARRSLPSIPLDSYSLMHLARRHAEDKNDLAVVSVCRRLLDSLPHFLPAIDVMIEARLRLGRIRSATEQIVGRIESIGLDETSRAFVRRLPLFPSPFRTEQLHRVMRADPAWTGRLAIARSLRASGRRREALLSLGQALEYASSPSEITLLSAQIHADLGQRRRALDLLNSIQAEDADHVEALHLSVQVASLLGDMDAIDAASAALLEVGDVANLQRLAKRLLFDRRIAKVLPILDALAQLSGRNDPWVLEQFILLNLIQGSASKAREAAARAEAFTPTSLPARGLIIASSIAGESQRLRVESTFLLDHYPHSSTQVAEAILTLFAGDPERTRALLAEAIAAERIQPEWILVAAGLESLDGNEEVDAAEDTLAERPWTDAEMAQARQLIQGSEDHPRTPLAVLGVLLAAQNHHYAPYALEQLNLYAEGERSAWDAYLIAKTLRIGGEELRARDALWSWVQADSEYFSPAWDMYEQIELSRLGHGDRSQFDQLRLNRLRSRARSNPTEHDTALATCYELLEIGNLKAAGRCARSAHALDETGHEANAAMARVASANGDHLAALNHWLSACEHAPHSHRVRYVTGALKSVDLALSIPGAEVLPSVTAGVLESLSRFSPADPRIPLALARLDLRLDDENPALGVARAFRRLDNFRRKADDRGLAELHAGTEQAWLEFYLQYGPEQALDFCHRQLTLTPGVLSLWLGEVKALRALGRYEDALDAAAKLHQMAPSGPLYEEIAACLQATGASPRQVEAQLARALDMAGEISVEAMLTRTKSLLAVKGERTAGQAISVLSRVWDSKASGPLSPTDSEVALLLSESFMKRGKPRDYHKARQLLQEVSARTQDPYDGSLAEALSGLCTQALPSPP